MPVPKLELLARGVSGDIQRMDANAARALIPAMKAAQDEIAADLAAWVKKLGPDAALKKFTVAQLRQAQLTLGIAQGQAKGKTGFQGAAQHAVLDVLGKAQAPFHAARTLTHELEQLHGMFSDMPPPQLIHAATIAQGNRMVTRRYPASAARYAGQIHDDLKFQFAVGLSKGEMVGDLVQRISKVSGFRGAVDAANPDLAGKAMGAALTKRYHHWADRLVRTELVNAYNYTAMEGIKRAHKLDDRIVSKWDASLDARVCPVCRGLHGSVAKDGTFPGGYVHPPAHPHCRCAVIAWMAEWDGPDPEIPQEVEEFAGQEESRARRANRANIDTREVAKKQVRAEARAVKLVDVEARRVQREAEQVVFAEEKRAARATKALARQLTTPRPSYRQP